MDKQSSPYVLTRFDPLSIIMQESPRAVELLSEYGIHCVSCFFYHWVDHSIYGERTTGSLSACRGNAFRRFIVFFRSGDKKPSVVAAFSAISGNAVFIYPAV